MGLSKDGKRIGLSLVSRNLVALKAGGFGGTGVGSVRFLRNNQEYLRRCQGNGWKMGAGFLFGSGGTRAFEVLATLGLTGFVGAGGCARAEQRSVNDLKSWTVMEIE